LLSATHLTRRFNGRVAVHDVSFELGGGEILALLGPNGAGKTTTLRMLAGLIAPTSGEVRIEGRTVSARNASPGRARVGLLTESPGLWDRLTVRENLITYAKLYGLAPPAQAVDAQLERFDLGPRAGDLTARLSKGLRQRVALARTLLHDPSVVLLDEPTSGLDPESAHDVRALMRELRQRGRAVLVSSHNLHEVERLADRVAILRTHLVAVDSMTGLRARAPGRRLRIGLRANAAGFASSLATSLAASKGASPGSGPDLDVQVDGTFLSIAPVRPPASNGHGAAPAGNDTPDIVRRLVELGAEIESVVVEEASLEDVYLQLLNASTEPPS
jgi:ABC-2 type transport system ATP-binding protein